jgi:predicted dinucleotide-binding enzyme
MPTTRAGAILGIRARILPPGEDSDMSVIAVVGTGRVGMGFAEAAVAAGHRVVLANSRGPQTLTDAVASLGDSAQADTVEGAAARADMVLLAVPLHSYSSLPASALEGRIVMDAGNYYTDWSGHIAELDEETTTTSELLQSLFPSARVVKAFNSIYAEDLAADARPGGGPGARCRSPATTRPRRRSSPTSSRASASTWSTPERSARAGGSSAARPPTWCRS